MYIYRHIHMRLGVQRFLENQMEGIGKRNGNFGYVGFQVIISHIMVLGFLYAYCRGCLKINLRGAGFRKV